MKVYAANKRATFDYELVDKYVVGIVLSGQEAKSTRMGGANLKGSFVSLYDEQLFLHNSHISAYKFSDPDGYDPEQSRKLLAHKSEIQSLIQSKKDGFTIIPTKIGAIGKYIKLEIATAKGKKKSDKRSKIDTWQSDRELKQKLRKS